MWAKLAKLYKMPVGRGGGGHSSSRETVTASLFLMFKECGWNLAPPLIKSINNLLPWRKNLSNHRNMLLIMCCCAVVNFETFLRSSRGHCSRNEFNAVTKLSWMNAERWRPLLWLQKKRQSPQVQMQTISVASMLKNHWVMNVTFCYLSCQCSVIRWWTLLSHQPIRCCQCWSGATNATNMIEWSS